MQLLEGVPGLSFIAPIYDALLAAEKPPLPTTKSGLSLLRGPLYHNSARCARPSCHKRQTGDGKDLKGCAGESTSPRGLARWLEGMLASMFHDNELIWNEVDVYYHPKWNELWKWNSGVPVTPVVSTVTRAPHYRTCATLWDVHALECWFEGKVAVAAIPIIRARA